MLFSPSRSGSKFPILATLLALCLGGSYAPNSYSLDLLGFLKKSSPTQQSSAPGPIDEPHEIVDPAYGEALYEFYQQHYFAAITRLLVAKQRSELTFNKDHGELLLGSVYVAFGMLDQGEQIFSQYLASTSTPQGADLAWYQLAKIHYQRNNYQKTVEILTTKLNQPFADQPTEYQLLLVLSRLYLGELESASTLIRQLEQPADSKDLLIRFNLAASYELTGEQEQAADIYQYIRKQAGEAALEQELSDQATLALGVQYYQAGNYQQAIELLDQVRLFGASADKALLTKGRTLLAMEQPYQALTPWLELSTRPLTSAAVSEAIVNVPYLLETLGALQDALDGYRQANRVLGRQFERFEALKQRISQPNWIETISPVRISMTDPLAARPEFNLPKDNPEAPLLYRYFASNEFQYALDDYRDLQQLYLRLYHWRHQLPSFDAMIDTHLERLYQVLPLAVEKVKVINQLRQAARLQLDNFNSQLNSIMATNDLLGMANPTQQDQQQRLAQIQALLDQLNNDELYRLEREKLELLQGVLLWDLNNEAPSQRWQAKKNLLQTEAAMVELEGSLQRLAGAKGNRLDQFEEFTKRTQSLDDRLKELLQETERLLVLQRRQIQDSAIAQISKQQDYLNQYRTRALFAIARLQDVAFSQQQTGATEPEQSFIIDLNNDIQQTLEQEDISPTPAEDDKPVRGMFDLFKNLFRGKQQ